MKKLISLLMALLLVLTFATPIMAIAESAPDAIHVPATWRDIVTQAAVWVITLIAGIVSIVLWKWVYPLLRDTIVPWLEEKNLLVFADAAVKYAEALLGRFNGEKKWEIALQWLDERGWNIDSEAVIAAVKAAHYSLNLEQLKAGIKKPEKQPKPPERIDLPAE